MILTKNIWLKSISILNSTYTINLVTAVMLWWAEFTTEARPRDLLQYWSCSISGCYSRQRRRSQHNAPS